MSTGPHVRRAIAIVRTTALALTTITIAAVATPKAAHASPSVWARARDPRLSQRDAIMVDAQKAVLRYRELRSRGGPQTEALAAVILRDARQHLGDLVASGAADFAARLLYAEVLRDARANDEALKILTKLIADNPPEPIRADALGDLAILHALAGRREEEIRAYTESLKIEPHAHLRSRLLANRAEALMATGDITAAIEGYREALAPLTSLELYWYAPTTLFGLGVALDRSGDLPGALDSIKLARAYDPHDKGLQSGSWFFSPAHDSHWYWALGAWSRARSSTEWPVRADQYERAVFEWETYLADAPADDRWIPLARVRLDEVKRERDHMRKAYDAEARKGAAPRFSPDKPIKR
ncbi:MAG: hypothetical protein U0441_08050 [Polyangiaceae bacterium]